MLIEELRIATRSMHQRLEQTLNLTGSMLTFERYQQVLLQFQGFYHPLEKLIPAYGSDARLWITGDRRKSHLLAEDLNWLDRNMVPPTQAKFVSPAQMPNLSTPAKQIGCMYVIEGSTLGGQYLLPYIARQLELSPHHGASFFASYGAKVGAMWGAFRDALEREGAQSSAASQIIDAACETFEALDRWFSFHADSMPAQAMSEATAFKSPARFNLESLTPG